MTRFPSRLPAGYALYVHGADLILRYGSEDTVFTWYSVLPVRDPVHAVNLAMEVDERIQEHRGRRRRWGTEMLANLTGADPALLDAIMYGYPWHPWGGMERGV